MKLTITHSSFSKKGTKQSITGKQVFTLGRRPDNDCVFSSDDDQQVSGYHAEIRIVDDAAYLIDLNSKNGSYVNEHKVTRHPLLSGDLVQLGENGPGFIVEYARASIKPAIEPPDNKLYGKKTLGLLIDQALKTVGKSPGQGTSKSTDYFESLMDKKVKRTSLKIKVIVAAAIVFTGITALFLWYYIYTKPAVTNVYQTTQVVSGENAGGIIANTNRYNVFMIAGTKKQSVDNNEIEGFCTGFAIAPSLIATNAHCVKVAGEKYSYIYVLMNGAPRNRYSVTKMISHPAYSEETISPDVAIFKINGQLSSWVKMASPSELAAIAPGVPMFLYGFPGRLNNVKSPEATFIRGEIGRVTTFAQHLGQFGENTLLQHSAFCTGGTSGSPMFNANGHVIGINAGGYLESGQILAGYNFGMRIDLINTLLASI